jgi:hypothetical protein
MWIELLFSSSLLGMFAAAHPNAVAPETRWRVPKIRVCWAARELLPAICEAETPLQVDDEVLEIPDPKVRRKIAKWVTSEFSNEKTGIRFSGWRTCAQAPESDIYLFYAKAGQPSWERGMSSIGNCGQGEIRRPGKAWLFTTLYPGAGERAATEQVSRLLVLHEFGHLSGLLHEEVDPTSLMNLNWKSEVVRTASSQSRPIGLSEKDRQTLKSLYRN